MASIEVPYQSLDQQTLHRLIEEFVTRQGAICGDDVPLQRQVEQVLAQLRCGKAMLIYDDQDESCTIVPRPPNGRVSQITN